MYRKYLLIEAISLKVWRNVFRKEERKSYAKLIWHQRSNDKNVPRLQWTKKCFSFDEKKEFIRKATIDTEAIFQHGKVRYFCKFISIWSSNS